MTFLDAFFVYGTMGLKAWGHRQWFLEVWPHHDLCVTGSPRMQDRMNRVLLVNGGISGMPLIHVSAIRGKEESRKFTKPGVTWSWVVFGPQKDQELPA